MEKGDSLPEFSAKNQNGELIHSSSFLGEAFVLYFYPKNETKGCIKEACTFRDEYEDFKELGAEVIGVSADSVRSHQKFATHRNLPFILLSDADKKIRKLFGIKNDFFGLIPGRETFVFDSEGYCVMKFRSQTQWEDHISKAKEKLKELKV
jgi:peroxiredoxin Q/BCP